MELIAELIVGVNLKKSSSTSADMFSELQTTDEGCVLRGEIGTRENVGATRYDTARFNTLFSYQTRYQFITLALE
jgi:hypothetical protein